MTERIDGTKFTNSSENTRLDLIISRQFPKYSKRFAKTLCARGLVHVNGKKRSGGYLLSKGELIEIAAVERAKARPALVQEKQGALAVEVLHEDEHLLIVSKPRAMHSVTLSADDPLTLADWLSFHARECQSASTDEREGGLVQRLDYFTSGVVIAAKHLEAWKKLTKLLHAEKIEKRYLALVEGRLARREEVIRLPLVEQGQKSQVVSDETKGSFAAETQLSEVFFYEHEQVSVVRASAARARRHQIRVHLQALGHPLVGDDLYGSNRKLTELSFFKDHAYRELEQGFLLHAESVSLVHPLTGKPLLATAASKYFEEISRIARG